MHNKSLRKKRRRTALAIGTLLAIMLWPVGAWGAARLLIVRQTVAHPDAIVVLSGSATFLERAHHAAALYHEGRAQRIILTNDNLKSGWSSASQRNPYYHELAKEELRRAGVPEKNIEIIMIPIVSTHDEALRLRDYCEWHGVASIVVVTSAYHSRRALWTFRRVFRDTNKPVGIDPVETGIETPSPATWWLHKFGWTMVPNEYAKMIAYRFRVQ